MIQEKPCKGSNGDTRGYGCGALVPVSLYGKSNMTHGLGHSCKCYPKWLFTSKDAEGKKSKFLINNKKKVENEHRKQTRQAKIDLLSPDKYRAKYLQPRINEIVRLIDYGHACIATNTYGKMNAGHYISVGANRTICLNLHNIFIQSFESNHFKSGDPIKYQEGLIKTFGFGYFEFVNSLRQHKPLNISKQEMILKHAECLEIIKELKRSLKANTALERITLRNEINLRLNMYDPELSEYVE